MNALRRFIVAIPVWAFALMFLIIGVNIIYLVNMYRVRYVDIDYKFEGGKCIISEISAWGPTIRAGLKTGDIVLSIDSIPISGPEQLYSTVVNSHAIGDTLTYKIVRNNEELTATRILSSYMQEAPVLYYIKFLLILFFSCLSVFILYKKPSDRSVRIFFIFFQLHAIFQIAYYLPLNDLIANFATITFLFSVYLTGPALIHFILIFPRPALIYIRFRRLPVILYSIGCLPASFFSTCYLLSIYIPDSGAGDLLNSLNRMHASWVGVTCCIAIAIAVSQFRAIKNTVARNQLLMVITGAFFGFSVPSVFAVFYDYLLHLDFLYPFIFTDIAQEITIIIMMICFLIALFRYRIWNIELYLKKALLYLVATLVITLTYFLLIFLVNQLAESESDIIRFLALAVSVIIFLVLRDRLQQFIDRIFHRESYDTATVVASFEEKLAGIYHFDELKSGIVQSLDDIFHFKSLVFSLKKTELVYEPVYSLGLDQIQLEKEYKVTHELEHRLQKSNIFSPAELDQSFSIPEMDHGELIVPLMKEDQPFGFFVCGPKKSEKTYSLQDIRVLSLIAKRIISLFHTASLYQKDLDRQLMLERERARISQDMHDDVGASLTRISILSELAQNRRDNPVETSQWLCQISDTSRGVMEEMSQIIWALNPRNDTLEGLVAYLRRFVYEYLEPTTVNCIFDLPEKLPDRALSVEVRRNVYLVVREALHNVVKHALATKVFVSIKMNENGFRITIRDDGKGFNHSSLEFPGNGLVNMKKRMHDIEGKFLVKSKPGDGTVIELGVRMN